MHFPCSARRAETWGVHACGLIGGSSRIGGTVKFSTVGKPIVSATEIAKKILPVQLLFGEIDGKVLCSHVLG